MNQVDDDELERLSSGITGLDTVLRGGFIKNGVYIIQGVPGTGKTVFGNQLCFNHVKGGGRAVYVTLLSESHARMLFHLKGMSFFDARYVPEQLYYVSGFKVLEEEGLKSLLDLLRREVRGHGASVLVLDGLVAAEETAGSDREFKKFIHEVQIQASMLNCTTFLLTNGGGNPAHPEHTMVDGLIELGGHEYEGRQEREMNVRKFRGSSSILGGHAFRITDDGIVLYPRIEALLARPSRELDEEIYTVTSGIDHLDRMLDGGFQGGSTTMLLGPSGVGKTTLGLHFLSRSSKAEPGLMFGFYESPNRIVHKAKSLGLDLRPLLDEGALDIIWQPPTENLLDALGARILDGARKRGVRRLFIDGLGGFKNCAFFPERVSRFFAALANEFRARKVTTVYTSEAHKIFGSEFEAPNTGISPIVENLILLRYVEYRSELRRLLSIIKVRDSDYDPRLREFSISPGGISLSETFQSAEAILVGSTAKKKVKAQIGPTNTKRRKRARGK